MLKMLNIQKKYAYDAFFIRGKYYLCIVFNSTTWAREDEFFNFNIKLRKPRKL